MTARQRLAVELRQQGVAVLQVEGCKLLRIDCGDVSNHIAKGAGLAQLGGKGTSCPSRAVGSFVADEEDCSVTGCVGQSDNGCFSHWVTFGWRQKREQICLHRHASAGCELHAAGNRHANSKKQPQQGAQLHGGCGA